jgi:hypothetical protein
MSVLSETLISACFDAVMKCREGAQAVQGKEPKKLQERAQNRKRVTARLALLDTVGLDLLAQGIAIHAE